MTSDPATQEQLGSSSKLPTRIEPGRAEWEAAGFHFGTQDDTDPLFTHTLLPLGWYQDRGTGPVWKVLRDELQRVRVHLFYEPAPHIRDASMRLLSVAEYVEQALQHDQQVVVDEEWVTRQAIRDLASETAEKLMEEARTLQTGMDGLRSMVEVMDDYQRYRALGIMVSTPEREEE